MSTLFPFLFFQKVTIHTRSKHHAKNLPAKLSVAAKSAASVFLMMFRTAYTLIPENTHPLTCKHDKAEYFLKPAVNSNLQTHLLNEAPETPSYPHIPKYD